MRRILEVTISLLAVSVLAVPCVSQTIGQAKQLGEGEFVSIEDAVVTAEVPVPGSFYVESQDRSSGIKITNLLSSTHLNIGQKLSVYGKLRRVDGEWEITDACTTNISDVLDPLKPLLMTSRMISNDPDETLNYRGICTVGLLVKMSGKVTAAVPGDNVIYVDDGGGYHDGLGGPAATTEIGFGGNLDSTVEAGFIFETVMPVYDSLGEFHLFSLVFTKTANPCEWTYELSSSEATFTNATGTIHFSEDTGRIDTDLVATQMTLIQTNGSLSPMELSISLEQVVQLNGAFTFRPVYQNGWPDLGWTGTRVKLPEGVGLPQEGSCVAITGISRVEKHVLDHRSTVNGRSLAAGDVIYVPSVWVRDLGDVQVMQ